jgi:FtsZ-binding cell division protein ZapB
MSQNLIPKIIIANLSALVIVLGLVIYNLAQQNRDKTTQISALTQQVRQKQDTIDDLQIKVDDAKKKTALEATKEKAMVIKDNLLTKAENLKETIGTKIDQAKDKVNSAQTDSTK